MHKQKKTIKVELSKIEGKKAYFSLSEITIHTNTNNETEKKKSK
jgi:hypothetical protein